MLKHQQAMRNLSQILHEIRDKYTIEIVKLHNQYWKNIDLSDDVEVQKVFSELYPLLLDQIFACLTKIIKEVLEMLTKYFKIKNKVILNVEDLLYQEDNKTLFDRLFDYYITRKGQNAIYHLVRLLTTETEYVFSGVMQDKIDIDKYDYFVVDNLDGVEDCEHNCPTPLTIFPIGAEKPPYHPDCECFWYPITKEEAEKNNLI